MSRTYKDRPARVRYPDTSHDYEAVPYIASGNHWSTGEPYERLAWFSVKKPYIKRKKKRNVDTEWRWMTTPGWWVRLYMTRPQRNASNHYMRQVTLDVDLEEVDPPGLGHKPHIYYW